MEWSEVGKELIPERGQRGCNEEKVTEAGGDSRTQEGAGGSTGGGTAGVPQHRGDTGGGHGEGHRGDTASLQEDKWEV